MQPATSRWPQWVRLQDVFWILLFTVLEALNPSRTEPTTVMLVLLALFQLCEPRVPALATSRGAIFSNLAKLILCYCTVGYAGGITSSYWPILMLPVVSAASSMGAVGTFIFTLLACVGYVSFAHPFFLGSYELTPDGLQEIGVRATFFCVVGYLTHQNRVEARRYQQAAEQLQSARTQVEIAEAAVRRSERLAALGQLSGGLAHELRNPLTTMRTSAELLLKNVPPDNPLLREMAGFVSSEVDRLNSIITRFLDFARPLEPRPVMTDVNEVLDRSIQQAERHQPPLNVSIYSNYSPDVRPFLLDGELMERVFTNLVLNAAQASPEGGTVTVKTREMGGWVEISVIDRGQGIDPKNRESIFNPFFTTKSNGVGLGLSIVSKIVDAHGGKIRVDSEPGQGSVFRVVLPARRGKDAAPAGEGTLASNRP